MIHNTTAFRRAIMKKTRFTVNGKPVYKTRIGSLIFTHPDGQKEEVCGMHPLSRLQDLVDVFDETGHNTKYIMKYAVGWRGQPEDDHPCPCKRCQTKVAPEWWRPVEQCWATRIPE
jgi:hypothetical protein